MGNVEAGVCGSRPERDDKKFLNEPLSYLDVKGAGLAEVNGRYQSEGKRHGHFKYRQARGEYTIRFSTKGWWLLEKGYSKAPTLYGVSAPSNGELPPSRDWVCGGSSAGIEPAPSVYLAFQDDSFEDPAASDVDQDWCNMIAEREQRQKYQEKRERSAGLMTSMMAMHAKDDRFQSQIMLLSWCDYVQTRKRIAADLKSEKDGQRLLHKAGVSKAMFKLASSLDLVQLQVVFSSWKKGADRGRLKKEHDDHMKWVLLKMEGERSESFRHTVFNIWHDIIEGNGRLKDMSDAELHVSPTFLLHHQQLHKHSVHQAMIKLCSSNDTALAHVCFALWHLLQVAKHDHVNETEALASAPTVSASAPTGVKSRELVFDVPPSRTTTTHIATAEFFDIAMEDRVGSFTLQKHVTLSVGHEPFSDDVQELRAGLTVDIVELVELEGRLRGRVKDPAGWISISRLNDNFRWAEPDKYTALGPETPSMDTPRKDRRDTCVEGVKSRELILDMSPAADDPPAVPGSAIFEVVDAGSDQFNGYYNNFGTFNGRRQYFRITLDGKKMEFEKGQYANIFFKPLHGKPAWWMFDGQARVYASVGDATGEMPPTSGWECASNYTATHKPPPTLRQLNVVLCDTLSSTTIDRIFGRRRSF